MFGDFRLVGKDVGEDFVRHCVEDEDYDVAPGGEKGAFGDLVPRNDSRGERVVVQSVGGSDRFTLDVEKRCGGKKGNGGGNCDGIP